MERTTLLWTLVVFFGASVLFNLLRNLTEDESVGLQIGVQVAALTLVVVAITIVVRRQR